MFEAIMDDVRTSPSGRGCNLDYNLFYSSDKESTICSPVMTQGSPSSEDHPSASNLYIFKGCQATGNSRDDYLSDEITCTAGSRADEASSKISTSPMSQNICDYLPYEGGRTSSSASTNGNLIDEFPFTFNRCSSRDLPPKDRKRINTEDDFDPFESLFWGDVAGDYDVNPLSISPFLRGNSELHDLSYLPSSLAELVKDNDNNHHVVDQIAAAGDHPPNPRDLTLPDDLNDLGRKFEERGRENTASSGMGDSSHRSYSTPCAVSGTATGGSSGGDVVTPIQQMKVPHTADDLTTPFTMSSPNSQEPQLMTHTPSSAGGGTPQQHPSSPIDKQLKTEMGAAQFRRTPLKGWWKTGLCKFFDVPQGCRNGVNCRWAHGFSELKTIDMGDTRSTPPLASPFLLSAAVAAKIQESSSKNVDSSSFYHEDDQRASNKGLLSGGNNGVKNNGDCIGDGSTVLSSSNANNNGCNNNGQSSNNRVTKCRGQNRGKNNLNFGSHLPSCFLWLVNPKYQCPVLRNPANLNLLWNYIKDNEVDVPVASVSPALWVEMAETWWPFVISRSTYVGHKMAYRRHCGLCSKSFTFCPSDDTNYCDSEKFCPICPHCKDMLVLHMHISRLSKFWNVDVWNMGLKNSSCPWLSLLVEYVQLLDALYADTDKKFMVSSCIPWTLNQMRFNRLSFALNLLCNQLPTAERTLFMTSYAGPKLSLLNWAVATNQPMLFAVLLRNAFPIPLTCLPAAIKAELTLNAQPVIGGCPSSSPDSDGASQQQQSSSDKQSSTSSTAASSSVEYYERKIPPPPPGQQQQCVLFESAYSEMFQTNVVSSNYTRYGMAPSGLSDNGSGAHPVASPSGCFNQMCSNSLCSDANNSRSSAVVTSAYNTHHHQQHPTNSIHIIPRRA